MSAELGRLVAAYRQHGILVDTNILLLFFVGSYEPNWITKFKRTYQFNERDYQLLVSFLAAFERRITTPHILAEVSNLAGQLPHAVRYPFYQVYAALLDRLFEVHAAAAEIAQLPNFPRLALTDSGIELVARGRYLVLTDDAPFGGHLRGAGVDAITFAQLRNPA